MPTNINLVIRPSYKDEYDITRYGAAFFSQITSASYNKGIPVTDLLAGNATSANFFSSIEADDPGLVNVFGHGWWNLITCQNDEIMLESGINTNVLANRVVFALSCMAGRDLASVAINEGCLAFLGYDESFYLIVDTRVPAGQELTDELARGFFEAHNAAPIAYINGAIPVDSFYASQNSFNHWIQTWEAIDSNVAAFLVWNRDHQVLKTIEGVFEPITAPKLLPIVLALAPLALIPLWKHLKKTKPL